VENLVVPVLLGTPWIDEHISTICPRTREVMVRSPQTDGILSVPLSPAVNGAESSLRVAVSQVLPPFSESWVRVQAHRSGASVLRPTRSRDRLVQTKNAGRICHS
jgi:hypothetical protein